MGILKDTRIVKRNTNSQKVFENLLDSQPFTEIEYDTPCDYIRKYWEAYKALNISNNSLNGNIFELIVYTLLYREGILPFYVQASVAFVPGVVYDTILYSREKPISLSLKTSLRERFKQADLEAIALKYVHRKSECYLLTLDEDEANSVNSKIKEGTAIGLNKAINCLSDDINGFVEYLKKFEFCNAGQIEIIEGRLIEG